MMTGKSDLGKEYRMKFAQLLVMAVLMAGQVLGQAEPNAAGGDWPNWRGPNYDGISRETGWSVWPTTGAEILWRASVGTGFSSVTISQNRLYTMGNTSDTDTIYCLDAGTGQPLWEHSYPSALQANLYEGGPNATPTVAGPYVYTLGKHGDVFCLDKANGKVIWQRNVKKETGAKANEWGFAGSPLVYEDMVIVNVGKAGTALNKTDGAILWTTGKEPAGYTSAVPYSLNNQNCIAVVGGEAAYGLEAKTGKILWEFPWKTSYKINAADLIVYQDLVFISSGYNKGCALFRIADNKPAAVWENKEMRNQFSSSVLWQDHIYGFDGNTGKNVPLRCLEFATGKETWTQEVEGMGSLTASDGKLIYMTQAGELVIAGANPQRYEEIGRAAVLSGKCWTVPVLAGGRIYARNAAGDVVCVNVKGKAENVK